MNTNLLAHVSNGLLNANQVHGLYVAHNRCDETLLRGNSNADINVVAVDDCIASVGALDRGVDGRDVSHG